MEKIDPEELVFDERCYFCDEHLEFQNVYVVLLNIESPITLCHNCYQSGIVAPGGGHD